MPRRHNREKQKQKSLKKRAELKAMLKLQEQKQEKELCLEAKAEEAWKALFDTTSTEMKLDTERSLLIIFDKETGFVKTALTMQELDRKHRWLNHKFLAKYELLEEIKQQLEMQCSSAQLEELLRKLFPQA